jgi:hypothetical protein
MGKYDRWSRIGTGDSRIGMGKYDRWNRIGMGIAE